MSSCTTRIAFYFYISWIILFFPANRLAAQSGLVEFNRLDISQGLSNNQVRSILKDNKGFVWFATLSGLNRYDGYQFKVFRHDLRDSTSISDDNITRIFEGPQDKIWIDTHSGYNVFDPVTETVDRDFAAYTKRMDLPNVPITHMLKDRNGDFWFLMAKQSIYKYNSRSGKTTHVYELPASASPLTFFAQDKHADIWMVHSSGQIEKIDNQSGKITGEVNALTAYFKNEALTYSIFIDGQDEIWLFAATDARGVFHYTPSTGVLEQITKDSRPWHLNNDIVVGLLQDNNNDIWISTDHGGINVLNKNTHSIRYILNNTNDQKSLSENSITAAYLDNAGIIWVSTYKQGVSFYHADIIKFPLFRHIPSDAASLQYNDINDFAEDGKGNIWIGSNGGGLIYYDRTTKKFTQFNHRPGNSNSLCNDVIVCLYMDRRQRLWIGTYFGGLDCYDGKTFVHYRHNIADSNSIADDRIYEILEDSNNNLWVGTLSGGLDRLDREKNIFYHYKAYAPNSIHASYISELMEDREGNIWVGSANGVDVLEKKTGKFVYYSNFTNNPKGLSNNNIISLLQDSRGLIWAGTSDGLNIFDKKDNSFKCFRMENGLPSNTILTIVEDKQQRLWASTPTGLSCIQVQQPNDNISDLTISCKNYDELDGLQGIVFNENAALKTRRGEMAFGGANGFNLFDPETILPDKNVPSVVLTDLQVFNKSVGIGEKTNGRVILPQCYFTDR